MEAEQSAERYANAQNEEGREMLDILAITAGIKAISAMIGLYEQIRGAFQPGQKLSEEDAIQIKSEGSRVEANPQLLPPATIARLAQSPAATNKLLEGVVRRIKTNVETDITRLNNYMNPDQFPDELSREKAITTIKRDVCWQLHQLAELGGLEEDFA
jgi:hypothetical protein